MSGVLPTASAKSLRACIPRYPFVRGGTCVSLRVLASLSSRFCAARRRATSFTSGACEESTATLFALSPRRNGIESVDWVWGERQIVSSVAASPRNASLPSGQYSLSEAARILRLPVPRVRYWSRGNLVPGGRDEAGRPRFDFRELSELRKVAALREGGVPLQRIRKSVEWVRDLAPELPHPLFALKASHRKCGEPVVAYEGLLLDEHGQLCLDWDSGATSLSVFVDGADEGEDNAGERAVQAFEKGCNLDSDPGEYDAAAAAYRLAVQLDPEFADAHCNLGTLLYNKGERELARAHYQRALEADGNHLEAHFNLANLWEEIGRDQAALHHYRRAVELDPLFPEAHLNLALLFEKLDLHRSARRHWAKYLGLCPTGHWADVARKRLKH